MKAFIILIFFAWYRLSPTTKGFGPWLSQVHNNYCFVTHSTQLEGRCTVILEWNFSKCKDTCPGSKHIMQANQKRIVAGHQKMINVERNGSVYPHYEEIYILVRKFCMSSNAWNVFCKKIFDVKKYLMWKFSKILDTRKIFWQNVLKLWSILLRALHSQHG